MHIINTNNVYKMAKIEAVNGYLNFVGDNLSPIQYI